MSLLRHGGFPLGMKGDMIGWACLENQICLKRSIFWEDQI
ncbi:MAG: hypothetical protein ACI8Z0_001012 [Lentimonas sp.]|jgi:hypothetical protein